MFTLVLGIICLLLKFSLHYNDICYYYNVMYGSRFLIIISEFQFLVWKYFLTLSLPKVRNFAHFVSTFKHPVRHEILK